MVGTHFGISASPRSFTKKKLAMSPSATVHGGQHDTKYVTFESLLHATFVADESWGDMLEPARRWVQYRNTSYINGINSSISGDAISEYMCSILNALI